MSADSFLSSVFDWSPERQTENWKKLELPRKLAICIQHIEAGSSSSSSSVQEKEEEEKKREPRSHSNQPLAKRETGGGSFCWFRDFDIKSCSLSLSLPEPFQLSTRNTIYRLDVHPTTDVRLCLLRLFLLLLLSDIYPYGLVLYIYTHTHISTNTAHTSRGPMHIV